MREMQLVYTMFIIYHHITPATVNYILKNVFMAKHFSKYFEYILHSAQVERMPANMNGNVQKCQMVENINTFVALVLQREDKKKHK